MTNLTELEMRVLQLTEAEIREKPWFARKNLRATRKRAMRRVAGDARSFLAHFLDNTPTAS